MDGRVLIIDDDLLLRKVLSRWLQRDYSCECVASVEEALALFARDQRFDVIVCDRRMPTAKKVRDLVREAPQNQQNRVILASGGPVDPEDPDFLAAEKRFFSKTGTILELFALVRAVIAKEGRITA